MISPTQAAEYLDLTLGMSLPTFLVKAACDKVEATEPTMFAAGYSEADRTLIQSMAVAIIATAGAPRRIKSQGAPSGASRSFDNADDALTQLRRSLAALDTANTVAALVGPDPAAGAMLMVA